jgi:hypothetical protein
MVKKSKSENRAQDAEAERYLAIALRGREVVTTTASEYQNSVIAGDSSISRRLVNHGCGVAIQIDWAPGQ